MSKIANTEIKLILFLSNGMFFTIIILLIYYTYINFTSKSIKCYRVDSIELMK